MATHGLPPAALPPLPPGWTEHKAPTGHAYYYNAETKHSTYNRPAPPLPTFEPTPEPTPEFEGPSNVNFLSFSDTSQPQSAWQSTYQQRPRQSRPEPRDWPRSKTKIPDCPPWLLVKTRLRRQFVHNPDTGESYWKFPKHVASAVVQLDIEESHRIGRRARAEASPQRQESGNDRLHDTVESKNDGPPLADPDSDLARDKESAETSIAAKDAVNGDSEEEEEEYEEIIEEEEEYEDEDQADEVAEGGAQKRQRTEERDPAADQEVEFGEDDMAWQLAQMGQEYDLDPGEYGAEGFGNGEWEADDGLPMTDEDVTGLFEDLLEDFGISPFTTWETVIDEGRIVEDPRYTVLPSMKARREAFGAWSTRKAQEVKTARESQAKENPRVPYLAFLDKHATPKLYWAEFKRKFKRESELNDRKLSDKDREKLYRDHISRVTKMSEKDLERDLRSLLKDIPPSSAWHNKVSVDGSLPEKLVADVRYISLKPKKRDSTIREFLQTLPNAEALDDESTSAERAQQKKERSRRDQAFKDRQRQVEEEKQRQERDLRQGRRRLKESEDELRQAMR